MVEVKSETTYEVLCSIDLKGLVCKGILQPHLLGWKIMYERYLEELKRNSIEVSKQYISDEYNCSVRTVERIIKFMGG